MKYISKISLMLCMLLTGVLLHAQIVEKSERGTFALTNATINTITNGVVEGTLLIQDGKIAAIGENVNIPAGAETIDCSDQVIYPGFIDGGTQLGLSEVGSISLTRDYNEVGDFNPQMQALTAVNPNSVAIPVTRVEGVTTVLTKPSGGIFPGTAALINLVGYTPDQMYAGFKGLVLDFPSVRRRRWGDNRTDEELKKEEEKQLKQLNEIWDQAELYANIKNEGGETEYNPELEAIMPVINGEMTLLLEVNRYNSIESAIKWVQEREIENVVFTGVSEGWRVADKIAAANIPVITGPVIALPTRPSDRYDKAYANAGLMHNAGVKVAIRTDNTENVRNLPYNAGYAVAYGMDKDAALRAVTINPAEIFGVDDLLGSLEVGKSATLFVCTGDPFETKTQVTGLFIDGWQVPLESRHTQLYEEFLDRKPGLTKGE
jgi:imidazolonepropionase-like amidohydrolase